MECGREPGGALVDDLGPCPATTYEKCNGIHGGRNAGRVCWLIAGTMCGGAVQGTFAGKHDDCRGCAFYQRVREEEAGAFLITIELINRLTEKGIVA
jgi:hypothetical protein